MNDFDRRGRTRGAGRAHVLAVHGSVLVACAMLVSCRDSAPAPKPPTPPSAAGMPPAAARAPATATSAPAAPAAGGHAPSAPGAASSTPSWTGEAFSTGEAISTATSDPTRIEVGGLVLPKPVAWQWQKPTMQFRTLQYSVPSHGGASPAAELIFSAFPKGGAGPIDANIARWAGQFRSDDGTQVAPAGEPTTSEVNGLRVTRVELHGAYMGMGAAAPRPGTTQLAAIVEGPANDLFIRLLGPDATVNEARAGFDAMIAGMKPQTPASAPAPSAPPAK